MNAPPATAREGAFLALALADALSLGLPDPGYITMNPWLAGSTTSSAIDFQFSDRRGRDPLPDLRAWASRFGVTVDVSAGHDDPSATWHTAYFTHAGVRFHAYAAIAAAACGDVAGHARVTCDLPAGHEGRHEHRPHGRRPYIVWGPGVDEPAVPAASGQPVTVTGDEAEQVIAAPADPGWRDPATGLMSGPVYGHLNRLSCGCTFAGPLTWPAGRKARCDSHGDVTTVTDDAPETAAVR